MPESITALRTALAATRRVVAGISEDQWSLPTPCSDWDVAGVMAHLVQGNLMFAEIVRGGQAQRVPAGVRAGADDDKVAAYDAAADEVLTAFGSDGALDRMVTVPFGTVPGSVALHLRTTEVLVHGWDLAKATGQDIDVPDSVAAQELAFSERALADVPPDRAPFGPPQPVPPGARPLDRLAGLLGRTVQ